MGGSGANRPVSGKPGKKDGQTNKAQVEMSKQINLSAEQGRTLLNRENNVQVTEDVDKSESNEANFADQNLNTCRETGVENNKENLVIDNDGTTNREKANLFDKSTEEASISNQVNIEENSVRAVYNEGTVIDSATSQSVLFGKFSLDFLSLSFAIRVNLLHSLTSLIHYTFLLSLVFLYLIKLLFVKFPSV